MKCSDIHINVQDAAGDRILAGDMLTKDPTVWGQWNKKWAMHTLGDEVDDHIYGQGEEEDVHDYLGAARKSKKKFKKTPRLHGMPNACRIFGSIESNKVQGDFHITARGHGYMEFGMHLDHDRKLHNQGNRQYELIMCRIQLLPHRQYPLLRSKLPPPLKSSLKYPCNHRRTLLQVPVLHQHRPYHIHN
jgi:hypothetical protein